MKGFNAGLSYLEANCDYMRCSFETYGRPRSRGRPPGFATMVRIIIDQQVSVQAGAAIWGRLIDALGEVNAETVHGVGVEGLRKNGVSGPKAKYILGMAERIISGDLDFQSLGRKRENTIRKELTALKGVGDWTADIYLMFALGRRDVFPVADIALQAAAGRLIGLPERPDAKHLLEIGERWRPYRSVAAIALWHFYKRMPAAN